MLPWLLDLGLGVVDLGLAAAAVALVIEGLPGTVKKEQQGSAAENQEGSARPPGRGPRDEDDD